MNVPGLITVQPDQLDLLDKLSRMVGTSFLEERWYVAWLEALDTQGINPTRKHAITQAAIRADYQATAPYGCILTTADHAAAVNIYRKSELVDLPWLDLQEQAEDMLEAALTHQEQQLLFERMKEMEPVSGSDWPLQAAHPEDDYLYIISIGVDPLQRGTGAFGRLFKPLLAYADNQGLDCYLDCYSDRLEQLYGHYGFEIIERKSDPTFTIHERCMMRRPVTPIA
ncbi:MAG: GNAT family N-acetyltransferase [Gordonibacter sp.]|nr:GNAT family N-acetyltransferase [Gordonibacter sp.]